MEKFDILVVGGGHAGIEAAWAGQKFDLKCALVCLETAAIGRMSCNPAIGGLAKGQMVRDIDAMGGLMGRLADKAAIHFKMLNRSKGPAVWGPRAQMDMDLYAQLARETLESINNLTLIEGEALDFNKQDDEYYAVKLDLDRTVLAKSIIITSGTFLGAKMFTGLKSTSGGRIHEKPAAELAINLKNKGVKTHRLKTGTPARLDAESIDFSQAIIQHPDEKPIPFSLMSDTQIKNEVPCWIVHTSEETHNILREGFDRSPMFNGQIKGLGPRYCPSIEDKIHRFSEKTSHQLFLEPEGLNNNRIYVNGFSSSLPEDVQERALHTIPALRQCKILTYGYAVEYDAIDATYLHPTLEHKEFPGLYFAGQVNGTSGYEEAAAQGLIAGVNAAGKLLGKEPFLLNRADSYIGVMLDDLILKRITEPYRMFTSRSEYRLFLRQDNAEARLLQKALDYGLISKPHQEKYQQYLQNLERLNQKLAATLVTAKQINPMLREKGKKELSESTPLLKLLKRPEISMEDILELLNLDISYLYQELLYTQAEIKYAGFYERQKGEIERNKKLADFIIPDDFNFENLDSLRLEARQKLTDQRPLTVGNASQIPGVTPADVSALIFHLTKKLPALSK